MRKRKQRRKNSSSSEGDEEYRWDEENPEDEEEEEEESLSMSEDSDEPQKPKKLRGRTRRETKLRSVGEIQSGLRRSKRATRNRINYRQYDASDSDAESTKRDKSNVSEEISDPSENGEYSSGTQESDGNENDEEVKVEQPVEDGYTETMEAEERSQSPEKPNSPGQLPEKPNSPGQAEVDGAKKRRFLDLNQLAPVTGFEDGPNSVKDDDRDGF